MRDSFRRTRGRNLARARAARTFSKEVNKAMKYWGQARGPAQGKADTTRLMCAGDHMSAARPGVVMMLSVNFSPSESEPVEHAGAEVLEEHVALFQQFDEHGFAFGDFMLTVIERLLQFKHREVTGCPHSARRAADTVRRPPAIRA